MPHLIESQMPQLIESQMPQLIENHRGQYPRCVPSAHSNDTKNHITFQPPSSSDHFFRCMSAPSSNFQSHTAKPEDRSFPVKICLLCVLFELQRPALMRRQLRMSGQRCTFFAHLIRQGKVVAVTNQNAQADQYEMGFALFLRTSCKARAYIIALSQGGAGNIVCYAVAR